jgi:hypothetical protein
MNTIFGKLENGKLVLAPSVIVDGDKQIISNDASVYLRYGYKEILREPYPQGDIAYAKHYIESDTTITISWTEDLEATRQYVLHEIKSFDTSSAVNEFVINGIGMWLDGDTQRPKLRGAVQTYIDKELGDYPLCVEGVGVIPVAPTKLLSMLADIEVYAIECFTKTFEHKEVVNTLTTCEELVNYNYTEGYPEKLVFNL